MSYCSFGRAIGRLLFWCNVHAMDNVLYSHFHCLRVNKYRGSATLTPDYNRLRQNSSRLAKWSWHRRRVQTVRTKDSGTYRNLDSWVLSEHFVSLCCCMFIRKIVLKWNDKYELANSLQITCYGRFSSNTQNVCYWGLVLGHVCRTPLNWPTDLKTLLCTIILDSTYLFLWK